MRQLRLLIPLAAIVALLTAAGAAYAVTQIITVAGKNVTGVKFVSQAGMTLVSGQPQTSAWVNVPGAGAQMTVPSAQKAILVASFDAFSTCSAPGNGPPSCGMRITVNGVPMNPDDGADAIMTGNSNGELRSISRSSSVLAAGTYTVQVQALLNSPAYAGANPLQLTNWSLLVRQAKA